MSVRAYQRSFQPAWWVKNPHLQTILPVLLPFEPPSYTRERWDTPDDDFVDLDWVNLEKAAQPNQKILVLFHGLEGSSKSSYAKAMMRMAQTKGWSGVVVHWRSCSGEINRQRIMYHCGFSAEIDWIMKRMAQRFPQAAIYATGFSLGGNALLKWLGEAGSEAEKCIRAGASICAPHDLKAGAMVMRSGFNQRVYMRNFLGTLKQKGLQKLQQFPDIDVTPAQIRAISNFEEWDNALTAPLHGFKDAADYWQKSSCKQFLGGITAPTLVLNTQNDPIVPAYSLATLRDVSPSVTLTYPEDGGHIGFVTMRQMSDDMKYFSWMPAQVFSYFESLD